MFDRDRLLQVMIIESTARVEAKAVEAKARGDRRAVRKEVGSAFRASEFPLVLPFVTRGVGGETQR